ncbi:MAG TPA: S53 family peptidase, partial [Acidimicrobiales bacterium]|nr:S53 family peptidase [Acidimicrobiales bacterium]
LERWARARNLRVTWDVGEQFAVLSGAPAAVGSALRVGIESYRARTGRHFYASDQQPGVPDALSAEVTGIGRISNYGQPTFQFRTSDFVPNGGLTPSGLLQAYQATPLAERGFQGQGETIVLIEYTPVKLSDLNAFTQKFGLPPIQLQFVGGGATTPQSELGEADMDIETVHEIAPKAKLVYFNLTKVPGLTNSSDFGAAIALSIAAAGRQFPGAVMSMSLQDCELNAARGDIEAINSAASGAEATGSTLYASSGDAGGADCGSFSADSLTSAKGVNLPAVAPDITGTGGTTLSVAANGGYLGETTWSSPMLSQGSGGGVSTIEARPSWQVGQGVGAGGVPDMREVPDVAADADPITGNAIVVGGMLEAGGGTSLSAPIWAGLTSLMDEFLHASGAPPLGFANPLFYKLANDRKLSPPPFHDVTVGGNDFYRAGPGYDPVTGVGTPDIAALAEDILAATKSSTS